MKKFLILYITIVTVFYHTDAKAHCQIPCGVYGDSARFEMISEHIETAKKAMQKINSDTLDSATLTRWVITKEEHAQKIQDIAAQYFLTQRVKTPDANEGDKQQENNNIAYARYQKHTTLLHQIMVAAMKVKQTTDLSNIENLKELVSKYREHYFSGHDH